MAELGDMLGKILEDPESMKMVNSLLSSLGEDKSNADKPEIASGLSLGDNAIDMEKLAGAMKLWSGPPDERCRLLLALKPFVSSARQEKIEQSVKILKLMHIAEKMGGLSHFV